MTGEVRNIEITMNVSRSVRASEVKLTNSTTFIEFLYGR